MGPYEMMIVFMGVLAVAVVIVGAYNIFRR